MWTMCWVLFAGGIGASGLGLLRRGLPAEALDGLELSDGFSVARAAHRLLGGDERVDRQDVEWDALDFDPLARALDLLVVAETVDVAEAIEPADVGVEVLEFGGVLRFQFQGLAAGRHAMHGMHVAKGSLQGEQVRAREITADVDILRDVRAAVDDARIAADDGELHAGTGEPLQEVPQIAHRCLAFRSISTNS